MAGGTITIRRQIRSITNTKKVTKAMELVSASKMRKAVATTVSARPYARAAQEVLTALQGVNDGDVSHPLMTSRVVKTVGVIAIGSNRGLCGGFNSQLASAIVKTLGADYAGATVKVITLGRRLRDALARQGFEITADFVKQDITKSSVEIAPIAKMVIDGYTDESYDCVLLSYNHYVSAMKQQPIVKPLLPLTMVAGASTVSVAPILFEPSPSQVLNHLLPRLIETEIFQAVIESEASEHSARMVAMKNATESAKDILFDLQLAYNQIRQAAITQEIAEISAGRLAME